MWLSCRTPHTIFGLRTDALRTYQHTSLPPPEIAHISTDQPSIYSRVSKPFLQCFITSIPSASAASTPSSHNRKFLKMATDYDAYFISLRTKYPKATYPEPECSTLGAYLNGTTDAQRCARELTTYTNRRVPADSKLRIWDLIILLARDFAETQDDLVTIITAIRKVPASKQTGGIDWTNETQSFNETFRGIYDSVWSQTFDAVHQRQKLAAGTSELNSQWTNINAFSARLLRAGLMNDLANGLRLIVETLESSSPTTAQLETHLGAAAAWLEIAGKEIKAGAKETAKYTDWAEKSQVDRSDEVDNKRLAHWRERLAELSGVEGLSEDIAGSCERAMDALEQAMWEKKK